MTEEMVKFISGESVVAITSKRPFIGRLRFGVADTERSVFSLSGSTLVAFWGFSLGFVGVGR